MKILILIGMLAAATASDALCARDRYKKAGCYFEDEDAEVLFNDRDKIDWNNYNSFLRSLTCKCHKSAVEKHYKYFALRYYGICAGLNKIGHKWRWGPGRKCINGAYKNCTIVSPQECIGRDFADMCYEISVDGGYGKWSDYNSCSSTCGTGSMQRTRECNNPVPVANGKNCDRLGPSTQSKPCKLKDCPVDGKFGAWSTFAACSVTCGDGGVQTRTRKCDSPAPVGDGKDCVGKTTETKACSGPKCSVDGRFSDWTTWTACTKTCGGGAAKRTRECNNPKPVGSGKDCVGNKEETKGCSNDFCKGPTGVSKAQELVERFLKNFHSAEYPTKKPSGKFYKAIFDIQKAVAEEFISVDPSTKGKTVEERLKDLEKFLKVATEGGSIDFARVTLGKGLFTFMKKKIKDGLPIEDIDKAAGNYLKKIKNDIGEQKYNQIVSSQGDSTLMFTMDTTGSMKDEINAAKAIARSIITGTRDFDVDYILSPFNDPRTGPATYKSTKDRAGFVTAINGLRASGGGDCPERSFQGMLNALNKGPKYGSPMFVFTDASAKDDTPANMAALKAAADMNSATITFFSNLNGCTSGSKRGIKSYQEIASYTSGQVFPLKNEAELLKFTEFVKSSLQQDTMIASGGTLKGRTRRSTTGFTHEVAIDDGIAKLIVSIATNVQNTAQQVTLSAPDGKNVPGTTTMSMAKIFEVSTPVHGSWALHFPASVGKYEFSAQAVSVDAIEFAHNFMYQENPRKESPPFSIYNPVKDKTNMMIVRLGGVHRINIPTLRVEIVDVRGNVLQGNMRMDNLDAADVLNTTITPPNVPFKVRLSGVTKTGTRFERISRGVSKAETAFMRPTYAGNEFTTSIGKVGTIIQVQVLNQGNEESITFQAKATYGYASPASQTKTIRRMGFIQLTYNAPNDSTKRGKTERITITATKNSSKESFTQTITLLLL